MVKPELTRLVSLRTEDNLFIPCERYFNVDDSMSGVIHDDAFHMGQPLWCGKIELGLQRDCSGSTQKNGDHSTQKTAEPKAPLFKNAGISAGRKGHPFHSSMRLRKSRNR